PWPALLLRPLRLRPQLRDGLRAQQQRDGGRQLRVLAVPRLLRRDRQQAQAAARARVPRGDGQPRRALLVGVRVLRGGLVWPAGANQADGAGGMSAQIIPFPRAKRPEPATPYEQQRRRVAELLLERRLRHGQEPMCLSEIEQLIAS